VARSFSDLRSFKLPTEDISFDQEALSVLSYQNLVPADLVDLSLGEVRERMYRNRIDLNSVANGYNLGVNPSTLKRKTKAEYKPLVIVGPSGAGKGTLIEGFTDDNFGFSVSSTTRDPRPGEVNGVHYNFVTAEEFRKQIEQDEFIEWCEVHSNLYGTSKQQITEI